MDVKWGLHGLIWTWRTLYTIQWLFPAASNLWPQVSNIPTFCSVPPMFVLARGDCTWLLNSRFYNTSLWYRPCYLTIRPVARKGYGSNCSWTKPSGLLARGPWRRRIISPNESDRKGKIIKLATAIPKLRKYLFGNKTREKLVNFVTQRLLLHVIAL